LTHEEIIEIFIRAAEVDRKLPGTGGPAKLKAVNIGYVHSFADMNGWDQADKHEANWAWLDPAKLKATTNDVGLWEAAMEMIKLIPDPNKRRALWNWSIAKAGGKPFSRWCREVEGIQAMAGDWRRKAGIECIFRAFACNVLQHNENDGFDDFTKCPEISDKSVIITNDAPNNWMAEDARPLRCDFDTDLAALNWSERRNEARRERDKRRQAA